jgi:hypothetical protein
VETCFLASSPNTCLSTALEQVYGAADIVFFFFDIKKKLLMASDIFKSVCTSIGLAFHISLEHSVLRFEFNKSMKGANLLI